MRSHTDFIIRYALLAAPVAFLGPPDSVEEADVKKRQTIIRYLRSVNGKDSPQNNWLWFRVMGNLALVQSCGVPYSELKESINADLKVLDSFYVSDGWASDGYWNEGGRQMDYYSGSFAIQFSQLMYVRYAADLDPERVEVYKKRAQEFAVNFWRYFNDEGMSQNLFSFENIRENPDSRKYPRSSGTVLSCISILAVALICFAITPFYDHRNWPSKLLLTLFPQVLQFLSDAVSRIASQWEVFGALPSWLM